MQYCTLDSISHLFSERSVVRCLEQEGKVLQEIENKCKLISQTLPWKSSAAIKNMVGTVANSSLLSCLIELIHSLVAVTDFPYLTNH